MVVFSEIEYSSETVFMRLFNIRTDSETYAPNYYN